MFKVCYNRRDDLKIGMKSKGLHALASSLIAKTLYQCQFVQRRTCGLVEFADLCSLGSGKLFWHVSWRLVDPLLISGVDLNLKIESTTS